MSDASDLKRDLRFAAARHALGMLDAEEVVALARRSVELGRLPSSVCELATHREKYPAMGGDVAPLFEEWLAVEGIEVPERERAIWEALRGWISRIASGELAAYDGLGPVVDVVWNQGLAERTDTYLGDSHGIEDLVGCFHGREELLDNPDLVACNGKYGPEALVEHDKEIRAAAESWLRAHPAPDPH